MELRNKIKWKLGTPGKKDEKKKPRIFSMNPRNKELITWMNKNGIKRVGSQLPLHTMRIENDRRKEHESPGRIRKQIKILDRI